VKPMLRAPPPGGGEGPPPTPPPSRCYPTSSSATNYGSHSGCKSGRHIANLTTFLRWRRTAKIRLVATTCQNSVWTETDGQTRTIGQTPGASIPYLPDCR